MKKESQGGNKMNSNNNNIPKEPDFSFLFEDISNEKPEVVAGQFWTIFRPEIETEEIDETEKGQIVLVLEVNENNIFIVPVHATESTRTILDPLISEEYHNLHPCPVVAVVTMAQNIGKEPFETARHLGEMTKEGLDLVKENYNKYLNAIEELAMVQYKDAHGIELTDEEEAAATKAGVYKLCPVNGDIDSLIEFNNEISEILEPWHILAIAEMFAEEEEKVAAIAESKPIYNFFQKVASKIKITINDVIQPDFFPAAAAGEASKADHEIPVKINVAGKEEDVNIILEWDDRKEVTKIWLEGDCVSKLCHENIEIEVHFENGEIVKHQFDNDDNFEFEMPLKRNVIEKVALKTK